MSDSFPIGIEFLDNLEDKIFAKCAQKTRFMIENDPELKSRVETMGTLFSILSRISECYWGCKHPEEHTREYLLGKACNSFSACWILLLKGHYDASWSVLRELAEISNLFMLFGSIPEKFDEWKSLNDKELRKKFSPDAVRKELESNSIPIPIGKEMYGKISERFVHITPKTRPDLHSNMDRPVASGTFQKEGIENTINFMSLFLSQLALSSVQVLKPDLIVAEKMLGLAVKLKS